jgi:hypothetical protein
MIFKQGCPTARSVVHKAVFQEIPFFWDVTLRLVNNYHDNNGWQSQSSLRMLKNIMFNKETSMKG